VLEDLSFNLPISPDPVKPDPEKLVELKKILFKVAELAVIGPVVVTDKSVVKGHEAVKACEKQI